MQPMEIVPANAGEYLPHAVPWTREDFQTLFEAGLLPHFCQLINGMIVSTGCYSINWLLLYQLVAIAHSTRHPMSSVSESSQVTLSSVLIRHNYTLMLPRRIVPTISLAWIMSSQEGRKSPRNPESISGQCPRTRKTCNSL